LDANCAFAQEEFAGDLPSLNLSAAMDLSEQSIQEQRDLIIKDSTDRRCLVVQSQQFCHQISGVFLNKF